MSNLVDPSLYAQIQALPEHLTGEIINGELVVNPTPGVLSTMVRGGVASSVGLLFHGREGKGGQPGGWWILARVELQLGAEIHVPAIAGWKRESLPTLPDVVTMEVVPAWVCEVLCPGSAVRDRKHKARSYHAAGVQWYWLVDPRDRTVEVYRRDGEFWVRIGVWSDDEKARIEPFDAVELDLSRWWEGLESSA